MNSITLLVNAILALVLAYQAGKYGTLIEYERDVFKTTPQSWMYFYWIFDIVFAIYFVISIYGLGLTQGQGVL